MVYLHTKNKGQRYWNHNKYSLQNIYIYLTINVLFAFVCIRVFRFCFCFTLAFINIIQRDYCVFVAYF